jgi:hypothetical protein
MHNPQLAAQLRHGAGGVDGPKHSLPEAPPNWQQWVVGRHHILVVGDVLELRAAQMPGDFAEVSAPDVLDIGLGRGLLGQDDLTGDVFDVPVAKHHLHREAAHQALQVGHA